MLAAGQLWGVLRCEPATLSVEALAVSIFGEARRRPMKRSLREHRQAFPCSKHLPSKSMALPYYRLNNTGANALSV